MLVVARVQGVWRLEIIFHTLVESKITNISE